MHHRLFRNHELWKLIAIAGMNSPNRGGANFPGPKLFNCFRTMLAPIFLAMRLTDVPFSLAIFLLVSPKIKSRAILSVMARSRRSPFIMVPPSSSVSSTPPFQESSSDYENSSGKTGLRVCSVPDCHGSFQCPCSQGQCSFI